MFKDAIEATKELIVIGGRLPALRVNTIVCDKKKELLLIH